LMQAAAVERVPARNRESERIAKSTRYQMPSPHFLAAVVPGRSLNYDVVPLKLVKLSGDLRLRSRRGFVPKLTLVV
jgi:hypothetical protein